MTKRHAYRLVVIIAIAIPFGLLLPSLIFAEETNLLLHTKTFKLDPNAFYMNLQNVSTTQFESATNGDSTKRFSDMTTNVGTVETVDDAPGRHLRYSIGGIDTENEIRLLVAGFLNDLGVNLAPPKGMAFNDRQATLTVRATDEDLELVEQAVKKLNVAPPPEVTVRARFFEVDDEFLKTLLATGVAASTNSAQNRILTEVQFSSILKTLEERDNRDLLYEGEVTTLSGRQADFQVQTEEQTEALFKKFGITNGYLGGTRDFQQDIDTNATPYALILDVVPSVAEDGYTLRLKAIPTVTEVAGYENGKATSIRVKQAVLDTVISDESTLMLGGFDGQWVIAKRDDSLEVRSFRNGTDKYLVIFVTVMIIDAAGNPVHSRGAAVAPKPAENIRTNGDAAPPYRVQ